MAECNRKMASRNKSRARKECEMLVDYEKSVAWQQVKARISDRAVVKRECWLCPYAECKVRKNEQGYQSICNKSNPKNGDLEPHND